MNLFFLHKKPIVNTPLKFLLLISSGFMFASAMFTPIYALFVKEIGGSVTQTSTAWAIFLATAGLLTFITGKLENKIKETELAIVWSQYVICVAYILYYFTTTIPMLYTAMIVSGIGNALFWPAFHAIYTKHIDDTNSVFQWSIYDALAYLIPAIGAVIGGYLVKIYGFDLIFIIMAILSFISGTFILLLPRKIL